MIIENILITTFRKYDKKIIKLYLTRIDLKHINLPKAYSIVGFWKVN